MTIDGRHALVTGGGRGIGAAVADALARAGARVTITGRSHASLADTADRLRAQGARIETVAMDVTEEASVLAGFEAAAERAGPVTILVNNAGQATGGLVADTSLEDWNRVLAVNLTGAFLCSRAVLPGMSDAGWGRIVNMASTAGMRGVPRIAAYTASKHGLIGLTRSLALEVAKAGITVNAVCPGYTQSDMAEQAVEAVMRGTGRTREQAEARIAAASPLGRLLTPDEVAGAVVWLCSDGAAAVTGETVLIGG